jgi:predicted urease superfamily metal-dependent hydrolase
MEYLTLNEKTFIKANKIARELGYTADYIGQLCRAGKVEAQLVGRTWYVSEESIRAHKKNRYRSTKVVTQKQLHTVVTQTSGSTELKESLGHSVAIRKPRYVDHTGATIITPRYDVDETDLIPVIQKKTVQPEPKTGRLSVTLADADSVTISSESVKTVFEPSALPEIHFKGKVKVSSAEDEVAPVDSEPKTNDGVESESVAVTPAPVDDAVEEPPSVDAVVEVAEPVHTRPKKRWKHPGAITNVQVTEEAGDADLPVHIHGGNIRAEDEEYRGWPGVVRFFIFLSATIAGVVIGLCLLSISHRLVVDIQTIQNGYVLDLGAGIQLLKLYFSTYLGLTSNI